MGFFVFCDTFWCVLEFAEYQNIKINSEKDYYSRDCIGCIKKIIEVRPAAIV